MIEELIAFLGHFDGVWVAILALNLRLIQMSMSEMVF